VLDRVPCLLRATVRWAWFLRFGLHYDPIAVRANQVPTACRDNDTLRAEPRDYIKTPEEFQKKFETLMPSPSADPPSTSAQFARLVQDMTRIASQQELSSAMPMMFQPVASFYYSDGTGMFTLTGVVCLRAEAPRVRAAFRGWSFANLDWQDPRLIDVPELTTKERLHLQRRLPCHTNAGRFLCRALGYLIGEDRAVTEIKLEQYANFHRYFPYFMKAIP
jgi:hypothetical protein